MTPRRRREAGSISLWLVLATPGVLLLVGLVVDLSGQVHAQQQATAIAAQAARAGGQALSQAALTGRNVALDRQQAVQAARGHLTDADVDGTVVVGEATVTVTVRRTYPSQVLGVIGIRELSVTGSATARTVRAVHGQER
jgi:Flp pilus assembly protein TadG